ncbi:hypothetical protein DYB30_010421 [Aphanomyces astaci]|uniref:Protein kinase domain-containing protein n=2 Tax=Aphanomyces astaci TaxID=112090 RepID=A0A397CJK7_APHAT|nr:hypothetical protein DYB30_010421 [Aphanomyces astaci]
MSNISTAKPGRLDAQCDGCGLFPFTGPLFLSTRVAGFALCKPCASSGVFATSHGPFDVQSADTPALFKANAVCDGCSVPITATGFGSTTTFDFDLCPSCHASSKWKVSHGSFRQQQYHSTTVRYDTQCDGCHLFPLSGPIHLSLTDLSGFVLCDQCDRSQRWRASKGPFQAVLPPYSDSQLLFASQCDGCAKLLTGTNYASTTTFNFHLCVGCHDGGVRPENRSYVPMVFLQQQRPQPQQPAVGSKGNCQGCYKAMHSSVHKMKGAMAAATPTPDTASVTMCSQDIVTQTHLILLNEPMYASCYVTTVVDTNINSTLLQGDCSISDCFNLLNQNQVTAASSASLNCYMYDVVTKSAFPNGDLVNLCFTKTTTPTSPLIVKSTVVGSSSGSMVGGAVGGAVALFLLIALGCWCRRRHRNQRDNDRGAAAGFNAVSSPLPTDSTSGLPKLKNSQKAITNDSSKSGSNPMNDLNSRKDLDVTQTMLADLQLLELHRIPVSSVHLVHVVAEGAFGQVWLGNFMGDRVAVKKLLPRKATTSIAVAQFVAEIKLVAKIQCRYVVAFVGAAWVKPVDMLLVTEFMDRGDLRSVLQANHAATSSTLFGWEDKVECALSIAEGLVYLHSMDPIVIHRDLKSRNVLLDSVRGSKITDFGIARETYDQTLTLNAGTYRWMAPEVVLDGHYTEKADLFSFGVILSELSTELLPYANVRNDRGHPLTDLGLMDGVAKGRILPTFSATCPAWFRQLGLDCLALDPHRRPSATNVSFMLRSHLHTCSSTYPDDEDRRVPELTRVHSGTNSLSLKLTLVSQMLIQQQSSPFSV